MNIESVIEFVSKNSAFSAKQIKAVWELLEEGSTIPFISRYRKERTGSLDEVQVAEIQQSVQKKIDLEKRRTFILDSIEGQGKLTEELKAAIEKATEAAILEDLYLPYKPKRKTKATIAIEKGLEPLANSIFEQKGNTPLEELAKKYITEEVADEKAALEGAGHIIAERIAETADVRNGIRTLFSKDAVISTRVLKSKKDDEAAAKFKDYFEWEEPLAKIPSHRLLALRRGENEGFLILDLGVEEETALHFIEQKTIEDGSAYVSFLEDVAKDSYKRLIKPSIETEFRVESKKKADLEAIKVFAENLKELLMAAPLGEKSMLALDPGFRTGCKLVALDRQGKLLEFQAIYPTPPKNDTRGSELVIREMIKKYAPEAIAIGNGTASRETESFVKSLKLDLQIIMVNESGASIYSASESAREEFPDQDVTVRGAVSIGRRLADPLAELVKIDPKSIGVGQYQHDVDQGLLKNELDDVVVSSVNKVGVDVNTASKELLTYISGLGPVLAKNILEYRNENGAFKEKKELKKVARMGEKAFEQSSGFLRIRNGNNPLDNTGVHPERYNTVKQMAKDAQCAIEDLIKDQEKRKSIDLKKYVTADLGLPTLTDILAELEKPGRDPRAQFEAFSFDEHVHEVSDLKPGMELNGIVTNVTNFGAFVDIGVHQDGLVHVSQLSNNFVSDPTTIVKVNDKVKVRVLEVDVNRKRISLTMKSEEAARPAKKGNKKPQKKQEEPAGSMADALSALKNKFK